MEIREFCNMIAPAVEISRTLSDHQFDEVIKQLQAAGIADNIITVFRMYGRPESSSFADILKMVSTLA